MDNGTILKQRYKILRHIGSGGMAEVYLAEDLLLSRQVAIKVLRDQFNDDKTLLNQFKHEAQSAARLSNPSIINIFDVCEEGGKSFIVMEYVEGKTLKDLLEEKGRLTPYQAVKIACDIAAGLSHAHKRNIIHCDIKPHNILITENMMPKIADFGIARMISSMTMVYTNSVIGSVHYLSPEQASGKPITAQSDIYSLGIVLYEMLTGHVPFDGNTAVAVAMMHVEKTPPPLSTFVDGLPECLQRVIDKALAKDLTKRYATAGEMWQDLKAIKNKMEKEGEAEAYPVAAEEEITEAGYEEPEAPEETIVMTVPAAARKQQKPKGSWLERLKNVQLTRHQQFMLAAVVVVLSAVFLLIGNVFSRETVKVPDVTGKTVVEAQKILENAGFSITLKEAYDDKVTPGLVLEQDPAGDEMRKEGSAVYLTVSKGIEMVEVPNLTGKTLADARKMIERKELALGKVETVFRDDGSGLVIEQSPKANEKIEHGSKVNIVISEKPKEVTIPSVVNKSSGEAMTALEALGFKDVKAQSVPSKKTAGTVLGITPKEGAKVMNSTEVILRVADGVGTAAQNKYAEFVVPEGEKRQKIRIVVSDDDGERTVYEGTKRAGVRIRQKVEVSGNAVARMYSDNKLVEEKQL
ncbi:MAG: Stk1 family PASTA domain-containing Ser/Thr kinase [Phascolarctobacterium sp.]|nr:MAG: Stk1 family PASTA domain-containing Ser/Thr kinase [Phascolarctobacterium sp.]